jgi:alkylhydroperoxidase family enzyme
LELDVDRMSLVPRARDAAVTAQARRDVGFVPTLLDYVGACPWLARALIGFFSARPAHLPFRVAELVPYAVALDRGCRHCGGAFSTILRLAGYAQKDLRALEAGTPFAGFESAEAVALEHVVAVARGGRVDDASRLAAAGYGPAAQAELTGVAALIVFGAGVATPLAIPPDAVEAFEISLLGKVLKPLIRWRIKASRTLPKPPPIDDAHGELFTNTVALLAGSPLHTLARNVLADAWRSPIIPVRDKAIVVWSVADQLGATAVAAEARAMFDEPSAARSRDAELVAYARASVAAAPAAQQSNARTLSGSLSIVEVLEVVGIAALANAIGRVGMQLAG